MNSRFQNNLPNSPEKIVLKSRLLTFSLLVLALTLTIPAMVNAQIIYNSFGEPGDQYDTGGGWEASWLYNDPIYGTSAYSVAVAFTPSTTAALGSIELPLTDNRDAGSASLSNFTIQLVANQSGSPTGSVLETLTTSAANIADGGQGIYTYNSVTNPILNAGTTYWIVATPTNLDTTDTSQNLFITWQSSTSSTVPELFSDRSFNFGTSTWSNWPAADTETTGPALKVLGIAPTPEPSTWALLLGGLGGVILFRQFRRKDFAT